MSNNIDRKTIVDKYDALSMSNTFLNTVADLVVVIILTTPSLCKNPLALIISVFIIIASALSTIQDQRFGNFIKTTEDKVFEHRLRKPVLSIVVLVFAICCIIAFIYTGYALNKTTNLILWGVFIFEAITTVLNAALYFLNKLLSH